ncbi:LamG-like jellyroll fold domain-containing protein [Methanohalophilus sp. RSK]|uniref:LamG-like jellyroll fold domain-containing protein n=1 Tax=Methanohalophilus sp. RSK TaxID=2485783 RepID=UPI0011CDC5BF|nr:LamG-like jellyroll fold domain-containing protein [Methanohalophilus sp. RSK]
MSFENNLCKDADGLAPVVGTILMVGIVVVLAAVIGTQALSVDTPDDHYERFKEITEQNVEDLPDGLVGWWTFDDTINDASQNSNHGVMNGDISYIDGVSGKCLDLDGNGYVEIPYDSTLDMTDAITVSVWLKTSETSFAYATDKWWYSGSADRAWSLNFQGNNLVWRASYNGQDSGSEEIKYDYSDYNGGWLTSPEWKYVTGTYDGNNLSLYVDGEFIGEKTLSDGIISTSRPLFVGAGNDGEDFHYDGQIDDLQIYNRALSESEISAIYNSYLK